MTSQVKIRFRVHVRHLQKNGHKKTPSAPCPFNSYPVQCHKFGHFHNFSIKSIKQKAGHILEAINVRPLLATSNMEQKDHLKV